MHPEPSSGARSRKPRAGPVVAAIVAALVVLLAGAPDAGAAESDGSPDLTFNTTGRIATPVGSAAESARGVAVQADGKIVTVGPSSNGTNNDFAIVRHNANGTLDTTFSGDGKAIVTFGTGAETAEAVVIQGDGKIVVAGTAYTGAYDDFAIARLNADGTLDTTFSGDGRATTGIGAGNDRAMALALQSDGKLVVAGTADYGANFAFALARFTSGGALDTTFSGDGVLSTQFSTAFDAAQGVVIQGDGKIVAAGMAYGSGYDVALARYTSGGALDTTFSGDGLVTVPSLDGADGVTMQSDGKIVVAAAGGSDLAAVRFTAGGALDTTFSGDGIATADFAAAADSGEAVAMQSDGTIVVAGTADMGTYNELALARFTAGGALDTSFSSDGKLTLSIGAGSDTGEALRVQSDGKLVVAGDATGDFGVARFGVVASAIIDNQLGDAAWRSANTGLYDVDFTDAIGLARFETRVWTGPGSTGTLLQDWTQVATLSGRSSTTDWGILSSTWTALAQGTNYASVRLWNSSGYSTSLVDAFTIAKDTVNPSNPGVVRDGTNATDVAYASSTASLSANWDAGADPAPGVLSSYDWCLVATTASTSCSGSIATGTVTVPTASVTTSLGGPYVDGTRYFFCVRSRDAAGNGSASAYTCSDGQYVDVTAPTTPTSVLDGTAAPDVDDDPTLALSANWAASTDTSPGMLADYEWCFNETADCATTPFEVGTATASATGASSTLGTYVAGRRYFFCIRARDAAGNPSAYACSNGQTYALSLTVSVAAYDASGAGPDPTTSRFGTVLGDAVATTELRVTVGTNSQSGYVLGAHDPDGGGALESTVPASLPWITSGSVAAPGAWSGTGLGISAFAGSETPDRWCTGGRVNCTALDDPDLLWAPLTGSMQQVSGSAGPVSSDTTRLPIRVRMPSTQPAGSYSGQLVVTVIANG